MSRCVLLVFPRPLLRARTSRRQHATAADATSLRAASSRALVQSCVLAAASYTQAAAYLAAALGTQQFAALQAALAAPPLSTCVRVNALRTTPEVCVCFNSLVRLAKPTP
jgi:hypothetical protein